MDDMGMMISDDAVKVSREELHTYCQLASKGFNFIVNEFAFFKYDINRQNTKIQDITKRTIKKLVMAKCRQFTVVNA